MGLSMTTIKWRDAYNTGVEQFDQEHHRVVELIDKMFVVLRDKSGKEVAEEACRELIDYTDYHFANEELAMAEANYPDLEEHKAEHAKLKKDAEKFLKQISESFPEGTAEFYHFLRDWLINHIQDRDQKYGPYLKKE
jgi:hemerythrin